MENEKYLIFFIDGHTFSLNFSDVKIIVPSQTPEAIPDFPEYVLGTIKYETKYIPVIDLRRRFHYNVKALTDRDCFIITDSKEKQVALAVDSISGFVEISPDNVQPAPQLNDEASARFLSGMFSDSEGKECRIINPELVVKLEDCHIFDK